MTSTGAAESQHAKADHDRIISLGNGDLLMIAGKNASQSGCGGSMGNGYGLVIHSAMSGSYIDTIKVLVEPYRWTIAGTAPRDFGVWTESHEISFNNGGDMHSCLSDHPYGTRPYTLLGEHGVDRQLGIETSCMPGC